MKVDSIGDRVQALVESNQANFNGWMLLIKEVEETSAGDIERISLVYNSFLSEFPLCYGYWTRYAGHKARLCTMNDVEEVYEQAVKAASYSVHIWVSYCSFAILSYEDPADIRRLFARGLSFVNKDYLCHLLWDKYIEFEYSQKQWSQLAHIYLMTLKFPTRRLQNYYESFRKLVTLLEEEMGFQNAATTSPKDVFDSELTYVKAYRYVENLNVANLLDKGLSGPEYLKKYLSLGELLYQKSSEIDKNIGCFEAHIRRPYFHVKPLDEFQLGNWHEYLTFVEDQGNFDWTVKLYERCLIPCANYLEFWVRYVDFVDGKGGKEIANCALERAVKVFLKRVPAFHLYYTMFKEKIGDVISARSSPFVQYGEDIAVFDIETVNRKANMEKRLGNIEAAQSIYDEAIEIAHEKNAEIIPTLYANFARFIFVVSGSIDAAKEVFIKGIQRNPCKPIIKGFLDFITSHGGSSQIDSVDSILVSLLSPESDISQALSSHDREEISQLYLKFVDLHGTIHEIRKAWDRHLKLFPRIIRLSASYDHSFNGIQISGKNIEGEKVLPSNLSNYCCGSYGDSMVENHSAIDNPSILPHETHKCELLTEGNAGHEKKGREPFDVTEAIHKQSILEGTQIDVINEIVNESKNVAQLPDALSEFHDTEMQVQRCKTEIHNNLEAPTLDNLSMNSPNHVTQQGETLASHDTEAPQEVWTREDGSKLKGNDYDDDVSAVHSNGERCSKYESGPDEDSSPHRESNNATVSETKTNLQLQVQAQNKTNQDLSVMGAYTQDQRPFLHGFVNSSQTNKWQAPPLMHSSVSQSYASQIASLSNTHNPRASHTQPDYHMVAAQAHPNTSLAFMGQHIQQIPFAYTQAQQALQSSQTQGHVYQHVPQIDEHYGHYQSFQGFPPHIWQYYQQLYYLQQQQHRSSQQDLSENQQERDQKHVQQCTPEHIGNLDQQQNATSNKQNQTEKPEASTQALQQSSQTCDQQQYLYFQQQQQFYLQQQQQQQLYLQQQHLFQQQQQQQQQQFLLFQQQQLQLQQHYLQQQMLIQPSQEQQSQTEQQKHQSPNQQRGYQPYQQQQQQLQHNSELEQKNLESNVNAQQSFVVQRDSIQQRQRKEESSSSQGERDRQLDGPSADSCFHKQPVDSPGQ